MFSIIIHTADSERALVHTLMALVPGATAGIVREVIVADAGSRDETEQVAEIAGARFMASSAPLGTRLKEAAASARGTWLMFLDPGMVPGPSWIDEVAAFMADSVNRGPHGAVFARANAGLIARAFARRPRVEQGLILPKSLYDEIGGHRADAREPRADLLRRLGRARLVTLRTIVAPAAPIFDFGK